MDDDHDRYRNYFQPDQRTLFWTFSLVNRGLSCRMVVL